jgi:glutaredoxin
MPDDGSPVRRAFTLVALGGLLITGAALAVRAVVSPKPAVEAEQSSRVDTDSPVHSASERTPLTQSQARPRETAAAALRAELPAPPKPEAASNAGVVDAGSTSAAAAPTPPSNSAIQAALKQTRIVMFATSWCPACERARGFLDANGLTRDERDVERDERARAELKRLTGEGSVPVFLVDGELVKGFSEKKMTRVLVASLERRLGFKGIRVRTAEGP